MPCSTHTIPYLLLSLYALESLLWGTLFENFWRSHIHEGSEVEKLPLELSLVKAGYIDAFSSEFPRQPLLIIVTMLEAWRLTLNKSAAGT